MEGRQDSPKDARDAMAFVWVVWATCTFLLFRFVSRFAVNVPYYDEWEMIPALGGAQPITLSWLWSQHNEHRIFLPKLVYLALAKVTGGDFRAGMYVNAIGMSLCAAATTLFIRRLRGRTAFQDAFFSLLLLNLGQAQTLTNSFQLAFVLASVLLIVVLFQYAAQPTLTFRRALTAAICTAALPLVGGHGIAVVPCLALCSLLSAYEFFKHHGDKRKAFVLAGLAVCSLALTAFNFVDYQRPARHPTSPGLPQTLIGTFQFLVSAFGSASRFVWPVAGVLCGMFLVATLVACSSVLRQTPSERFRVLRLTLLLGALLCLSLGTSWARVAFGPEALFASRYVVLSAPFWYVAYLVWEIWDRPRLRQFA